MSLDFNFQSLSLEDKSKAAAHADGRESLWRLDPDFTVQIDCVARLLVVEEITDAILESSGVLEIFSFRRTCRLGKRAVDSYNGRAFNVNRNLLRFFDDPESFRALQERTNTLISGSFALALLDRTVYPESDLDLYTHPGFARVVSEWLHGEGYQLIRRGEEVDWEETVVDNWRNLTRPDQGQEDDAPDMEPYDSSFPEAHAVYNWNRDGRTVQIISCTRCPFAAILGFHSTVVLNFISHRASYSLYPKATFAQRTGIPLEPVTDRQELALQKYKTRGWNIERSFTWDRTSDFQPYDCQRRAGDAYSWCLPDSSRINRAASSQDNIVDPSSAYGFKLIGIKYKMQYTVITAPILRLHYTIAGDALPAVIAQQLDLHWRRHRRTLERLPLEERPKRWIWKDEWLQKKLSEC
ncbi:hypothetical protein FIBSPDRAFT_795421 [Athelia psychrophila]|uniref:Uncharacterized protein n=1 Tax=Athelia psychrophila TaxID=1759441 RepID=A0A166E6G7_9AGAM|nr:hypothetical protein FIBSPDRAFT_795421 [Fibularhizoctonia sp. CBS 109695]